MAKQTKNSKKMAKQGAKQKSGDDRVWDGLKEVALNGNKLEDCTIKVTEMEDAIVQLEQMVVAYNTPMRKFEDGAWGLTMLEQTARILQLQGHPSLHETNQMLAVYRYQLKKFKLRITLHGVLDKEKNKNNKHYDGSSGGASGGASGLMA
jgi:hypothetical protein